MPTIYQGRCIINVALLHRITHVVSWKTKKNKTQHTKGIYGEDPLNGML